MLGPATAGGLGIVWGIVIVILGYIDGIELAVRLFSMLLGTAMFFLGMIMAVTRITSSQDQEGEIKPLKERVSPFLSSLILPGLIFPLLLPVSPLIFIFIKVNALFKPRNPMLKPQSAIGGRGESILEAAPQFALQCYIIYQNIHPQAG